MLSLSKDFVHYFPPLRSGQVHSLMAALTCLRYVETNLTLTCPSPKSVVCNLPDSGTHVTSVFQGLSLSLALYGGQERTLETRLLSLNFVRTKQDTKPSSEQEFESSELFSCACVERELGASILVRKATRLSFFLKDGGDGDRNRKFNSTVTFTRNP